jgi:transcriptional regulator with XRE-family HTH domain
MARYKTADAAKFAKMVGGNMRFLRLNHTPFRPQKVLAYFLGLTFQQVQKYEVGKNIPCSYRLVQIADFYKVSPNDLVDPSFIHRSTKDNEKLDRAPGGTPQDAGYLKPQADIGSLEEIKEAADGNL